MAASERGLLAQVWAILIWPFQQLWGWADNLWRWLSDRLSLQDVLLPSIYSSLVWLGDQLPRAFGYGSPGEQISGSFVLGVATFLTGIVTGGAAWVLIGLWAVTALIGVVRFVPAVESRWPL